ncbi:type II toxin-antitoxin system RelE/ParE family toxin [Flavisphingomonas formosensis]|uniref:type II toxin-antitoxin system RelE/ParE family toxin n=1 Tax=Flavisphingomonas formosensis TaxID=861534 RepID=UPI0012FB618D|nr:type II toxin-antitoxin system RelE/ParE family toxin [Sphingomonas formosensis]
MRRVEWSNAARHDIRTQVEYIAAEDPQAARRIVAIVNHVGESLGTFATGHPGRVAGTYEKSVRGLPYVIAYALTDDDAAGSILRVIHTSRDWGEDDWPDD